MAELERATIKYGYDIALVTIRRPVFAAIELARQRRKKFSNKNRKFFFLGRIISPIYLMEFLQVQKCTQNI
jgi:hypothetical protein